MWSNATWQLFLLLILCFLQVDSHDCPHCSGCHRSPHDAIALKQPKRGRLLPSSWIELEEEEETFERVEQLAEDDARREGVVESGHGDGGHLKKEATRRYSDKGAAESGNGPSSSGEVLERFSSRDPPPHLNAAFESRQGRAGHQFAPTPISAYPYVQGSRRVSKGRKGKQKSSAVPCDPCGKQFKDLEAFDQHHKAVHSGGISASPASSKTMIDASRTVCEVCSTAYKNAFQLRQHKGAVHSWSMLCTQCWDTFPHAESAMKHYISKHGARNVGYARIQEFLDSLKSSSSEEGLQYTITSQAYACDRCGQEYFDPQDLARHNNDLSCHGAWGVQSPDFPPLTLARAPTPLPDIPLESIDLSQQIPSFAYIGPTPEDPVSPTTSSRSRDPANPSFGDDSSHSATVKADSSIIASSQAEAGVIGEPHSPTQSANFTPEEPSVEALTTTVPSHHPRVQRNTELDAEYSLQVPSFMYAAPDEEFKAYPTPPPGPLPAPCKAPVSAWSKPLPVRIQSSAQPANSAPNDRLSFSNPDFDRLSLSTRSPSPALSTKPTVSTLSTPSVRTPASSVVTAPRAPWVNRGMSPKEKEREHIKHHKHSQEPPSSTPKAKRDHRISKMARASPSPPLVTPALEPRFDDGDWITITDNTPSKRSMGGRSAPAIPVEPDIWQDEPLSLYERQQVSRASLDAGQEDPYGGW